ncbi:7557_t:CDS:2, partial [Racocetra persica]
IENDVHYNISEIEARDIEYDAPRSQWREVMCSYRPINLFQKLDFYLVMATLPLIFAIHGGNSAGGFIHTWFSVFLCCLSSVLICFTPISCCIEVMVALVVALIALIAVSNVIAVKLAVDACMTHPCPLPACAWFGWNMLLMFENLPAIFLCMFILNDDEKDPRGYSPERSALVTAMGGWWFIISSAVAIGNTFMYVQCENDPLGQAPTISHYFSFWFGAIWDLMDSIIYCLLS